MESVPSIGHIASIPFNASRIDDLLQGNTGEQAMKDLNAKKKAWLQFRRQALGGFVALPNRLVDSKAFASLTTGASVKTLVWFWQMAVYEKGKKKAGAEPVIGRIDKIENNGKLSFTYRVAKWRGMNARRFSRALKVLFRLGFIDITRPGRGVPGEYTMYAISNRWQEYGTPNWKEIPFPENAHEGFCSESYKKSKKKIADENVRYPTDENIRYEADKPADNGRKRPLIIPVSSDSQRTKSSVFIDLAMPLETSTGREGKAKASDAESQNIPVLIRRRRSI